VFLGQREGETAGNARDRPGRTLLLSRLNREVRVPDLLAQQRISDGAADDPGIPLCLLQGETGRRDRGGL
jgi:hypothetical protein